MEEAKDLELRSVDGDESGQKGDRIDRGSAAGGNRGDIHGEEVCNSLCIRLYAAVLPYEEADADKHRAVRAALTPKLGRLRS